MVAAAGLESVVVAAGAVDVAVNFLTFGLGMFATSRIVTRFGMPLTLADEAEPGAAFRDLLGDADRLDEIGVGAPLQRLDGRLL